MSDKPLAPPKVDHVTATDAEVDLAEARAEPMKPKGEGGAAAAPPPSVLEGRWKFIKDIGPDWFTEKPPYREHLLATDANTENPHPDGLLPMGEVGMLAAAGGSGKSFTFAQLALAVATGVPWFGLFGVLRPGHVAMAMGEEDVDELRRRLHYAARVMNLTEEQQRLASERILLLPLRGVPVSLTLGSDQWLPEVLPLTPLASDLRQRLQDSGVDWRLVILDPLSRFAGPDVEIDNKAATSFVQVLETFVTVRGRPAVLFAHHFNKPSTGQGDSTASAARGSSALSDGVRWQANLDPLRDLSTRDISVPSLVQFRVTKGNYGPPVPPIKLTRRKGDHGVLTEASEIEIQAYENAAKATSEANASAVAKSRVSKPQFRGPPAAIDPED